MGSNQSRESVLRALGELHREIDREADEVAGRHGDRLNCARGCSACCIDGLSVTAVEAERIRSGHADLLSSGSPHAPGGCAFLDGEGACRIYRDRPSVCRSQGLPLRILFEDDEGEIAERRDICPLNQDGGPALGELDEDDCWLIGPHELKLIELDRRLNGDGETAARVSLRSLFRACPKTPDRVRCAILVRDQGVKSQA